MVAVARHSVLVARGRVGVGWRRIDGGLGEVSTVLDLGDLGDLKG